MQSFDTVNGWSFGHNCHCYIPTTPAPCEVHIIRILAPVSPCLRCRTGNGGYPRAGQQPAAGRAAGSCTVARSPRHHRHHRHLATSHQPRQVEHGVAAWRQSGAAVAGGSSAAATSQPWTVSAPRSPCCSSPASTTAASCRRTSCCRRGRASRPRPLDSSSSSPGVRRPWPRARPPPSPRSPRC